MAKEELFTVGNLTMSTRGGQCLETIEVQSNLQERTLREAATLSRHGFKILYL